MDLCVSAKGNLFVKLQKDGEDTVICLEPISKSFYDKQSIIEVLKAEEAQKEKLAQSAK